MPDRPTPPATVAQGWVQFAGEMSWSQARFTTTASPVRHELHVQRAGTGTTSVDLAEVTSLEELLGGPVGYHHLEIEISRSPAVQAVWPPAFTDHVLACLAATVDTEPTPPLVGAVATGPASAIPVIDVREPRRRANAGLIGALALVGCGALIVGALGLRDPAPQTPVETKVLTQTTLRGPAVTAPTTTTIPSAPTLPPANECLPDSPTTTTVADLEAPEGCEPG